MFNFFKDSSALSPQEVAAKIGQGGIGFIDVRTEAEYRGGHARGATNIPLDQLAGREGELKSFTEVYVICRSGGRSAEAVEYLRGQGINAFNVSGGTAIWSVSGLAME